QHQVIQSRTKQRTENNGAPAEPVRQTPQHRREDKLHHGIKRGQRAIHTCSRRDITAAQRLDQLRQNGNDQTDAEDIENERDENEGESRLARAHGWTILVLSPIVNWILSVCGGQQMTITTTIKSDGWRFTCP